MSTKLRRTIMLGVCWSLLFAGVAAALAGREFTGTSSQRFQGKALPFILNATTTTVTNVDVNALLTAGSPSCVGMVMYEQSLAAYPFAGFRIRNHKFSALPYRVGRAYRLYIVGTFRGETVTGWYRYYVTYSGTTTTHCWTGRVAFTARS